MTAVNFAEITLHWLSFTSPDTSMPRCFI